MAATTDASIWREVPHRVTVTLDSTGYGHDTWACSCGARNESRFGGMFPMGDHITDGTEPVVDYVLGEED